MNSDEKIPNHEHSWRGTWNRPMEMDENTLDAFTIARMTDHNVRATDKDPAPVVTGDLQQTSARSHLP